MGTWGFDTLRYLASKVRRTVNASRDPPTQPIAHGLWVTGLGFWVIGGYGLWVTGLYHLGETNHLYDSGETCYLATGLGFWVMGGCGLWALG